MDEAIIRNDIIGEDTGGEMAEEVRAKHDEQKRHRERSTDIFIMQITVCIIILLIIAAANIIRSGYAEVFALYFRDMTGNEPEKFIQDAISRAVELIK